MEFKWLIKIFYLYIIKESRETCLLLIDGYLSYINLVFLDYVMLNYIIILIFLLYLIY